MRSDDELSPRPTKRRRISHEYRGFSISGTPRRGISPQEVIQISSDASSDHGLYSAVQHGSASDSPSRDSQLHIDESPSGDIVDTSDNEERLVLHDYSLYRSDAPSPTTYHAPSGRSTSPVSPIQMFQSQRKPASSSITHASIPPSTSRQPSLTSQSLDFSSPTARPLLDILRMDTHVDDDDSVTESDEELLLTNAKLLSSSSNTADSTLRIITTPSKYEQLPHPRSQSQQSSPSRRAVAPHSVVSPHVSPTRSPSPLVRSINLSQTRESPLPRSSPVISGQLSRSTTPLSPEERSPSLSPAPPSPPTRRTRPANKDFRPYTAYIQKYGDTELKRMDEQERNKHSHRSAAQSGGRVEDDDDEDGTWVASQSLVDEESQNVSADSVLDRAKNRLHVRPKPIVLPAGLSSVSSNGPHKSRPEVPVPSWENHRIKPNPGRAKGTESSTSTNLLPLKSRPSGAPRRFLDLNGNPVKAKSRSPLRTNDINGVDSHYARNRGSPETADDALMQLYADEEVIDIDNSEPEGGSEHESIVEQDNIAPPTDPDTAPSGPDEMAEDTGSEEEETQFPVRKPRGIINKRSLVLDDESQVMEVGQGEDAIDSDASEEDEDREDNVDKERERILSKVWPAVLIKKNAQREREKELERQRRRRDEEKARRQALGLGDSDVSDEDVNMDGSIRPGQSRTRKAPDGITSRDLRLSMSNNGSEDEVEESNMPGEVIDLTSDRESLDNDEPENLEAPDHHAVGARNDGYDDTEDWGQYDQDDYPMEVEAIEDNRLFDGGKHRGGSSAATSNKLKSTRRGFSTYNSRNRQRLWQSRLDSMLNSTNGGFRSKKRSRHTNQSTRTGSKRPDLGGRSHHDQPKTTVRFASDSHKVTNRMGAFGPVQTKLPFEPVQDGTQNSRESHEKAPSSKGGHHAESRRSPSSSRKRGHVSSTSKAKRSKDGLIDLFDILTRTEKNSRPKASDVPMAKKNAPSKASFFKSSKSHPPGRISGSTQHLPTPGVDPHDPDSRIEISLNSALAFGMRRNRDGYSVPETSWLARGRLLDLVNVLCEITEPTDPLPCYVSTLQLNSSTSLIDLQLQFPTVCDLLSEFATKSRHQDDEYTRAQELMRFVCLYISASIRSDADEAKTTLQYIRGQIITMMIRVEDRLTTNGITGSQFNLALLSLHWFVVEVTSRISRALATIDRTADSRETILSDTTNDRFTISLMSRLLEFGVRRAASAFTSALDRSISVEQYALELWIALIHSIVLLPSTMKEATESSRTFWRLVIQALDQSGRPFPSAVHETEFIFSTIFFLCSISSIDALGRGQETRRLHAYWPIVCKGLKNVDLSTGSTGARKVSQATLAAKDTYVGMLFARCNVLACRWDWALEDDSKELFDLLRGVLRDRRFMNLLHEQSDFPYFITKKNIRLLHVFEPKDSIQTIVIKLMLKKVLAAGERVQAAKKWISLLASTSELEFTREKPPTQKELSALFNQFTIKLVFLYINPDVNNAKAQISSSKKIVNFQDADQRSRQVCIRTAMIFGRFCRHFKLSLEEVVRWMTEMGTILLIERSSLGQTATPQQIKECDLLCALLVASLRDVLCFESFSDGEEDEKVEDIYPESSFCMIDFITKILVARRSGRDTCQSEIALLLRRIFDLRQAFFPPPQLPPFPAVVDEESQEDYGFDPIDISDPSFMEIMRNHEEPRRSDHHWELDTKLAEALSQLNTPVASLIGGLSYSDDVEHKRANAELWIHCYARLGAISTTHNLKSWDYFLQRGPASLGRVGDLEWQQCTEPLFWLEVLRADPKVYQSHPDQILKAWFMSLAADPAHQLPALTYVVFRVDGFRHKLFDGLPFRRSSSEEEYDDDAYLETRLHIVQGILRNLERYQDNQSNGPADSAMVKVNVQGFECLSLMLKMMGHNVQVTHGSSHYADEEYREYCREVISCIRTLSICAHPKLAPVLEGQWTAMLNIAS